MSSDISASAGSAPQAINQTRARSYIRWWVCGLLFFATTINYMDRQVMSILAPTFEKLHYWTQNDYTNLTVAFQASYAIGYALCGWFVDEVGLLLGFAIIMALWSLTELGTGMLATGIGMVGGFVVARLVIGLTAGANFPAAIKGAGDWFPKKERALAIGLLNAGSNVGAILSPLLVPVLTLTFGWPASFISIGILGVIWFLWWVLAYRHPEDNKRISQAELTLIRTDPVPTPAKVSWITLLFHRQTWTLLVGQGFTSPIWWFLLFWGGSFFSQKFHLDLKHVGLPLVIVYIMADFGSIFGGWLSSGLIKRGWSVNASRKSAMLLCALTVTPIYFASTTNNEWVAIFLYGLAAASHQGFSANVFATVPDTVPGKFTASVTGLGGMLGSSIAVVTSFTFGRYVAATGNYHLPLAIASFAYLFTLVVFHLINPKLEPMRDTAIQSAA
ncbi:MAG TPA: MFS transporter [Phycisphaerae bacterium]|nr:MFS transporter [Phycisphaerae bacterium]